MHALILSLLLGADPAATQAWPGFRGDGTGLSTARHLPVSWSAKEGIAWKTSLPGYGQSAPVVWGNRVYVTAVEGEDKEKYHLVAVDANTGTAVWTKEFAASQKGRNNPMMSRAAPTPVVDADGVYAFFEGGDLVGLNHAGEVKWQRSLVKEYGEFKNNHGLGSSLAQTAGTVIVQVDHAGPSYLLAADKKTGKNHWKTDRPSKTSWTTPVVTTRGGKPMALVSSGGTLSAYDTDTGKILWTHEGLTGNNIVSPTVHENRVIIGAGENRMNPDLVASAKSNCCLLLTGNEPGYELVWQGKKAICHHASPLIHQGHVYFVTKTGVVYCVDLKTGEERYSERLDNQCWATPVAAGDAIYFFGKDGMTTILKAGSKYEKIASNRLWNQDDLDARKEAEKKAVAAKAPARPEGKGPGGGPPLSKEELEATRHSAVGDVVYGVAAVEGTFFIRTGTELICVRDPKTISRR
ncbi:outer membrane protein assembly factor BamB family protein [Zavarzinella formosa]|uniref:outer membrane protein assembly factor BamB family protein n=1 Tax=Zavarzinella formosa TaxID=360055 RepID=UPI00030E3554|nr:PQQ-binding-like beta-propeller repeat protein [Zavarzinella formosa]